MDPNVSMYILMLLYLFFFLFLSFRSGPWILLCPRGISVYERLTTKVGGVVSKEWTNDLFLVCFVFHVVSGYGHRFPLSDKVLKGHRRWTLTGPVNKSFFSDLSSKKRFPRVFLLWPCISCLRSCWHYLPCPKWHVKVFCHSSLTSPEYLARSVGRVSSPVSGHLKSCVGDFRNCKKWLDWYCWVWKIF